MKNSTFKNKVVLVTGASSGVGYALAIKFAQLGANLVVAARRHDKLEELKLTIERLGVRVLSFPVDISDKAQVKVLIDSVMGGFGRIDILIANAGQYIQSKVFDADYGYFEQALNVNFYGTLYCIKSVLPEMTKKQQGHIVIINSLDAKKGIVGDGPYVAAKSALDGLADVLRQELKPINIVVTSVFPARIDTPMIEGLKVPAISPKIKTEKVVRAILSGIKKKKVVVYIPGSHRLIGVLNAFFPKFMDWLYRKFRLEGEWQKRNEY